MSDYCFVKISVPNSQLEKLTPLCFDKNKFSQLWDESDTESDPQLTTFVSHEANYGYQDELTQCAKAGAEFWGENGAGGQYGPNQFIAVNGEYIEIGATLDGNPVVTVNEKGQVNKGELAKVRSFLKKQTALLNRYL